jgi:hypothetical protein
VQHGSAHAWLRCLNLYDMAVLPSRLSKSAMHNTRLSNGLPFYGCDEHGETIADCVQDENLTIVDSDSTATGLSKNERKSASELKTNDR